MGIEIERKFLIPDPDGAWLYDKEFSYAIWQGYLAKNSNCNVRLRIED